MLTPLRHLAEIVSYRATRERHARDDEQALGELERRAVELPRGVGLEWLGVSGYRISFEGVSIYVDPYVSRAPLSALLRGRTALPDAGQIDRFIAPDGEVAGVLVGHTHFDHAVDAPAIARRFGCRAYGSDSLVHLMALHGLGGLAVAVEPYREYELGPFRVSFTPSAHSKLLLGLAVPMDGELTCEHLDSLSPRAYRCGQVWGIRIEVAGASFYHQGSANLIDEAIRGPRVDYFLAGVAGRSFTSGYWERIVPKLDPAVVIPTHYDDFFAPLDAELGFAANVDLAAVENELSRREPRPRGGGAAADRSHTPRPPWPLGWLVR